MTQITWRDNLARIREELHPGFQTLLDIAISKIEADLAAPEGDATKLREALITVANVGSGYAKDVALAALRDYDSLEPQRGEPK